MHITIYQLAIGLISIVALRPHLKLTWKSILTTATKHCSIITRRKSNCTWNWRTFQASPEIQHQELWSHIDIRISCQSEHKAASYANAHANNKSSQAPWPTLRHCSWICRCSITSTERWRGEGALHPANDRYAEKKDQSSMEWSKELNVSSAND